MLWINLVFAGCGNFANKENGGKRDVRIVCVSKHLAEVLFALGKGHNIVARNLTSTYPDSAKLLPNVGYHSMLSARGTISTSPDIRIYCNDIWPGTMLPQLEKTGLKIKVFDR